MNWEFGIGDLLSILAFVCTVLGAFFALRAKLDVTVKEFGSKVDIAVTKFETHAKGMEQRVDAMAQTVTRIDTRVGDLTTRNGVLDQRVTDHARRLTDLESSRRGDKG